MLKTNTSPGEVKPINGRKCRRGGGIGEKQTDVMSDS